MLNVIDTAGIRDTVDVIEKMGVEKALRIADEADLIIYVLDSSTELDDNDENILKLIENKKALLVLNKTDLDTKISTMDIEKKTNHPIISMSVKENLGFDQLENMIRKMFFEGEITFNEDIYITNDRHREAFQQALDSLQMVLKSIEADMPEDFYSIDLMNAYEVLGRIIGENVEEDLVNMIFKEFCMGK